MVAAEDDKIRRGGSATANQDGAETKLGFVALTHSDSDSEDLMHKNSQELIRNHSEERRLRSSGTESEGKEVSTMKAGSGHGGAN